jgi:hypothetical protein
MFENVDAFAQCSASVGDYRACTADLIREHVRVMEALPECAALDVMSYPRGRGTVPVSMVEPSSCSMLYATCPKLER